MKIGYKGFNQDLQGYDNFQYEVGKTYELDGDLKIYKNGFHYYKRLTDAYMYYNLEYNRICEVEILGDEVTDNDGKFATDKIRIAREISKEDIDKYFEDNWEELIKDEYSLVRMAVARMGFGLDILAKDVHWRVRAIVAETGFGLDILVNDEYWAVRKEVARHGFGLDKLINDKKWEVRKEVAMHGFGLDILVNDKKWEVRREVAKNGFGLNILVYDDHWMIRKEVAGYGRDKDLDILVYDKDDYVRAEVTKHGRD